MEIDARSPGGNGFFCSEPSCMKLTTGTTFRGELWKMCRECLERLRDGGDLGTEAIATKENME